MSCVGNLGCGKDRSISPSCQVMDFTIDGSRYVDCRNQNLQFPSVPLPCKRFIELSYSRFVTCLRVSAWTPFSTLRDLEREVHSPARMRNNAKFEIVLCPQPKMLVAYDSSPEPEASASAASISKATLPVVAQEIVESDEEVEFDPTDAFGLKQAPTTEQKSVANDKGTVVASAPDVMVLVSCFLQKSILLSRYSTRGLAGDTPMIGSCWTIRCTKNGTLTILSLAVDVE